MPVTSRTLDAKDNGDGTIDIIDGPSAQTMGIPELDSYRDDTETMKLFLIAQRFEANGVPRGDVAAMVGSIRSAPVFLP